MSRDHTAFPKPTEANLKFDSDTDYEIHSTMGLTKREYFAGLALAALVSNPGCDIRNHAEAFASSAVLMADALLKALEDS